MAQITRLIIVGISLLAVVVSIVLIVRTQGSVHAKRIRQIAIGFIFIAFAKLTAITTKFCIEKAVIPKNFSWIMQVYELIGLTGLIFIVTAIWMIRSNKDSIRIA